MQRPGVQRVQYAHLPGVPGIVQDDEQALPLCHLLEGLLHLLGLVQALRDSGVVRELPIKGALKFREIRGLA